ncbi:hypothetical protein HYX17_00105 [Candidatus Woesearchaeota archaeon]|nr:hypothetical protein [Candidatus Woesearchaeota archaeon]
MKKAQADIIGLVVIVILFIIIAVVFLRLSTLPKSDSVVKENIKVSNLLNAMLKLTPCNNIKPLESLADIIDRCNNQPYCGSSNCRDYIKTQIENIAMKSFDRETYKFTITKNGIIFLNTGNCLGNTKFVDNTITPRFTAKLEVCS